MDRPDPDALWKPGYDGPWHVPAPDADPSSARTGRVGPSSRQLAVSALLGLIVVAVLVALLARVPTSRVEPAPADERSPVAVDVWSVTFPTIRIGALTVTDELMVVLVDRPGSVVAIDRRDGTERWRGSAPGTSATGLDVVDEVVLARHVEADGTGSVVAHDLVSGVPLWQDVLTVGERIDVVDGIARRSGGGRPALVVDPRTGEPLEGVGPPPDGPGTDHVLRGMSPGRELEVELPDARLRVVVDGTTSSVTLVHSRTDGFDTVDPSSDPPASVP